MVAAVLITGGAGFLGSALAGRLIEQNVEVTILDSLHAQVHDAARTVQVPAGARFLTGDVTHPDNWRTVLRTVHPDSVVHLAAETGTAQSLRHSSRHSLVNVVGTTQMMDAVSAQDSRPHRVVLASSRAVYGEGQWCDDEGTLFYPGRRTNSDLLAGRWDPVGPSGAPARPVAHRASETRTQPVSVYGATKLAQEHLLASWGDALGIDVAVLRFQNIYGPGQSLTNSYSGVLTFFAQRAMRGQRLEVFEDGGILRDFVFIDDAVAALEAAIFRPDRDGCVVDVGSGRSASLLEVAQTIADLAAAPPVEVSSRFRSGDIRAAFCDPGAAADRIKYSPEWTLDEGLKQLLDWVGAAQR